MIIKIAIFQQNRMESISLFGAHVTWSRHRIYGMVLEWL